MTEIVLDSESPLSRKVLLLHGNNFIDPYNLGVNCLSLPGVAWCCLLPGNLSQEAYCILFMANLVGHPESDFVALSLISKGTSSLSPQTSNSLWREIRHPSFLHSYDLWTNVFYKLLGCCSNFTDHHRTSVLTEMISSWIFGNLFWLVGHNF